MLAQIDTPEFLQQMHQRSQRLARGIVARLGARAIRVRVKAGTDLLARDESCYAFVENGVLRFVHRGRTVRFFSDGDLFVSDAHTGLEDAQVEASFACDVLLIPRIELIAALQSSPDLLHPWLELVAIESHLLLVLAALYATGDVQPRVEFRRVEEGEDILREGQECPEIYELIEGSALVQVGGLEVGLIRSGEFIGEISFLTESRCVATVTAAEPCFVQSIPKAEFARLVQARPQAAIGLARVLAKRVIDSNARLSDGER